MGHSRTPARAASAAFGHGPSRFSRSSQSLHPVGTAGAVSGVGGSEVRPQVVQDSAVYFARKNRLDGVGRRRIKRRNYFSCGGGAVRALVSTHQQHSERGHGRRTSSEKGIGGVVVVSVDGAAGLVLYGGLGCWRNLRWTDRRHGQFRRRERGRSDGCCLARRARRVANANAK